MFNSLSKILASILLLFAVGCGQGHSQLSYDIPATEAVMYRKELSVSVAEVRLYVTGPKRSHDNYRTLRKIMAMQPVYTTKDSAEISRVIDCLGDFQTNDLSDNRSGWTYHILLFESEKNDVMYFRVFSESLTVDDMVSVFPKSDTGVGYSNQEIVKWLRDVTKQGKGTQVPR